MDRMRQLRLSQSIVGEAEAIAVSKVLCEQGYLGMGTEVNLFECELAEFLGVPREWVVCVNTGTSALHLAVEAVTSRGDQVLIQSLTYVASFQAISAARAVPVSCEINPDTMTIDLLDAEIRYTNQTKAIMPVHYASSTGDLEAVYSFAKRKNIRVIEDAAHAFGCRYKGRKVGSFGDIVCFSFDGIKNITSGEGGAIVTSDRDVLAKVRDARLLGVEKDTERRFLGERSWEFDVRRQGYRYHMSNIMAAIGRVQLKKFPYQLAPRRVELVRRYRNRLSYLRGIRLLECDLESIVPHILPIRILGGRRNAVKNVLEQQGVATGIHYKPNHMLSLYGGGTIELPVTEKAYDELLSLPLHPGLADGDVDHVCQIMESFFGGDLT